MRRWRYTDDERPGAVCHDCGLAYQQFPVELVIAHDEWELINPTHHKGAGLLCHDCMITRLRRVNIPTPTILFFGINDWKCNHQWNYAQKMVHVDSSVATYKQVRYCLACKAEQDLSFDEFDL